MALLVDHTVKIKGIFGKLTGLCLEADKTVKYEVTVVSIIAGAPGIVRKPLESKLNKLQIT